MRIKKAVWNPTESAIEWRDRGRQTIISGGGGGGPVDNTVLFVGHVPYRNFWGLDAPESLRPTWDESMTIIGGQVYSRRLFIPGAPTTSTMNSNLAKTDGTGQYPVLSCKIPGEDWQLVANGGWDATLNIIRNVAIARRNAGSPPFAMTIHHEPDGNGSFGDPANNNADRLENLRRWAAMHEYCSDYFAGIKNGVYNAANDVSDIMAWCCIANGHWYGSRFPKPDRIAAGMPNSLHAKFKQNKSILMADFYDANPPNGDRDNPGGYASNADRSSVQIRGFIEWSRNLGGGVGLGCGEFGTTEQTEMQRVFDLTMENRDIWAITLYFNNFANSRWDWRLIPDSYPAYNGTNSKGLTDLGGSVATEGQLVKFRALRTLSVTPAYTDPF